MPFCARIVANYILDFADVCGIEVNNQTLQRLAYFCHVWVLVKTQHSLVKQFFEAREDGPVIPFLCRDFGEGAQHSIHARATRVNLTTGAREVVLPVVPEETAKLLNEALGFYIRLTPHQLGDMCREANGPWHRAWFHEGPINLGMKIQNADIVACWASMPAGAGVQ